MLIFLCLLLCFSSFQCRIIKEMEERQITVQLGTVFNETIPILFKQFQHSQITQFKRDTPYYENPLCHITFGQNGVLKQKSIIRHQQNNEADLNKDRIIYQFQKLDSLKAFIDAIEYKQFIVSLYSNNEVVFYEFDRESGALSAKNRVQIGEANSIKQAQFAVINEQLYLFTSVKAYRIKQSTKQQIQGYSLNSFNFNTIKSVKKYVLMSGGDKGIILYQLIQNALTYISSLTFQWMINKQHLFISVDKFSIDEDTNSIFILDQREGIIEADLSQLTAGKVIIRRVISLMGGCQNMIVTSEEIYLTCPELIQMSREKGKVEMSKYNSFYPFDIGYNGRRVFLFGHQGLAVYDIFGNVVSEHEFSHISQKSMVFGSFLITFSDQAIQSFHIVSHTEQLYCYTTDEGKAGEYKGKFITRGQCVQYFQTQLSYNDICEITYPFLITITNSVSLDLTAQIIAICIWLGISMIIGCLFGIQHHFAHRNYKQLIEQQSKQHIDFAPSVQKKKSDEEEVA